NNSSMPRQASARCRVPRQRRGAIGANLRSRRFQPSRSVIFCTDAEIAARRHTLRRRAEIGRRIEKALAGDDPERAVERAEHAVELPASAQDMAGCRDDAVGALPTSEPWIFFDPVDGKFAGTTENGKHRAIPEEIDGVITPFAGG